MKKKRTVKKAIPASWNIPEAFFKDVGKIAGRQKMLHSDGHILLVLHQLPVLGDDGKRERSFFWRNPGGEWRSSLHGDGIAALEKHVAVFAKAVEKLDMHLDTSDGAGDYLKVLRMATPLCRSSQNLVLVLEKLRDALPDDGEVMHLRDQSLWLERSTEFIASDARHGMDFCIAESAERQARASFEASEEARLLNRLVAFFFPVATLAAIGGMNPPDEVFGSKQIWMILGIGMVAGLVLHFSNVFAKWLGRRKRGEEDDLESGL